MKLCSAIARVLAQMIWYVKTVRMRTRLTVKSQHKKILCFLSKSQRIPMHLEGDVVALSDVEVHAVGLVDAKGHAIAVGAFL